MDVRPGVRTACRSGRLILGYQSANESEINRPLPQAVLTRAIRRLLLFWRYCWSELKVVISSSLAWFERNLFLQTVGFVLNSRAKV